MWILRINMSDLSYKLEELPEKYKLLYGESDSEKLRARMLRFGVSRGFPFGEVFEVTSRIIKENENS